MPIESIATGSFLKVADQTENNKGNFPATSLKNVNDKPTLNYAVSGKEANKVSSESDSGQPIISRLDIVKAKFNDDSASFSGSAVTVKCNNFAMHFIDVYLGNRPGVSKLIKALSLSTQNAESISKKISVQTQKRTLDIIAHGKENHLVDYQLWGEFFCSQLIKMQDDGIFLKPFLIYLNPRMIKSKLGDFKVVISHTMTAILSYNAGVHQITVYDPMQTTGYFSIEQDDPSKVKGCNIFSFINKEDALEFMGDDEGGLLNSLSYFTAVPGCWDGNHFSLLQERKEQRDICSVFLTERTEVSQREFFYSTFTGMSLNSFVPCLRNIPEHERAKFLTLIDEPGKTIMNFLSGLADKDCHLLQNYFSFLKDALREGVLDKRVVINQLSDKVVEDAGYAWFDITLFGRTFLRSNTGKLAAVFATEVINLIKENRLTEHEGKAILDDVIIIKEKDSGVMTEYPAFAFATLKHHIHACEAGEMIRNHFPAWHFGE